MQDLPSLAQFLQGSSVLQRTLRRLHSSQAWFRRVEDPALLILGSGEWRMSEGGKWLGERPRAREKRERGQMHGRVLGTGPDGLAGSLKEAGMVDTTSTHAAAMFPSPDDILQRKPTNIAVHTNPQHDLHLVEGDVPEPGPSDCLVHVRATGICGSDVHFWKHGRIGPMVVCGENGLGHESAGVVVRVGQNVTRFKPGAFARRLSPSRH